VLSSEDSLHNLVMSAMCAEQCKQRSWSHALMFVVYPKDLMQSTVAQRLKVCLGTYSQKIAQ